MRKLQQLMDQSAKSYAVELTPSGPVLLQSSGLITVLGSTEVFEIDRTTWEQLQSELQTGTLDNDRVKAIIKAQ